MIDGRTIGRILNDLNDLDEQFLEHMSERVPELVQMIAQLQREPGNRLCRLKCWRRFFITSMDCAKPSMRLGHPRYPHSFKACTSSCWLRLTIRPQILINASRLWKLDCSLSFRLQSNGWTSDGSNERPSSIYCPSNPSGSGPRPRFYKIAFLRDESVLSSAESVCRYRVDISLQIPAQVQIRPRLLYTCRIKYET